MSGHLEDAVPSLGFCANIRMLCHHWDAVPSVDCRAIIWVQCHHLGAVPSFGCSENSWLMWQPLVAMGFGEFRGFGDVGIQRFRCMEIFWLQWKLWWSWHKRVHWSQTVNWASNGEFSTDGAFSILDSVSTVGFVRTVSSVSTVGSVRTVGYVSKFGTLSTVSALIGTFCSNMLINCTLCMLVRSTAIEIQKSLLAIRWWRPMQPREVCCGEQTTGHESHEWHGNMAKLGLHPGTVIELW